MTGLDRRCLLAGATVAASAAIFAESAAAQEGPAPRGDARWDMINTLRAPGPRIVSGEDRDARLFDGFVGTWDTQFTFIQEDGSRRSSSGQLIAGWVLDGRALQDLWIGFPDGGSAERFMGTTLRFYDVERKVWRVTWVSPMARAVTLLEGGADGGRIVLHGNGEGGRLRWSFNDITETDFVWRGEKSSDNGATWRLREEHRMHRATRPA